MYYGHGFLTPNFPEPLYQLGSGNWATGTGYTPGGSTQLATQALRLRYFTARAATPISSVAMFCQVASSGTAPTLCRVGVWSLGVNGIDLAALVASTANDVALWAATGKITKALQAAWTPTPGQRYAVGVLCVSTGTLPSIVQLTGAGTANSPLEAPAANGVLSGQADLPASSASIVNAGTGPYAEFIP